MQKLVIAFLALIPFGSAFAAIQVTEIGSIAHTEIVRTLDKDQGIVCFGVRGYKSGDVSCVKRAVVKGNTPIVVGKISYGEIKRVYDDVFEVACTVIHSDDNASISCL